MKHLFYKKYQRGFTLIELLVVIAIIGILASVVLASLNTSRGSARDAKRLSEAKQLQTALEIFRNNNDGAYPCANGSAVATINCANPVQINSATPPVLLTTLNFPHSPDLVYAAAGGAIQYRIGSAVSTNDTPVRTSYSIRVRLENGRTNGVGGVIAAGGWCTISMGTGNANYNQVVAVGAHLPCF